MEQTTAPFTCKFCGRGSWVDPSDQEQPADICHESNHGEREAIDVQQAALAELDNAVNPSFSKAIDAELARQIEINAIVAQQGI